MHHRKCGRVETRGRRAPGGAQSDSAFLFLNSCRTEGTPPSGQGDVTVSLTLYIERLAGLLQGGRREVKARVSNV